MDSTAWLIVGLFGGLMLLGLIAIVGRFLHYRRERLLVHAERMKALELGRELPDDAAARIKAASEAETPEAAEGSAKGEKSLPIQVYTMTAWTSGCGMLFACWSSANAHGGIGVALAIALAAGAIGVTGMICGTILASKMIAAPPAYDPPSPLNKPRFDPEAV